MLVLGNEKWFLYPSWRMCAHVSVSVRPSVRVCVCVCVTYSSRYLRSLLAELYANIQQTIQSVTSCCCRTPVSRHRRKCQSIY